jgi:hypothetical protein
LEVLEPALKERDWNRLTALVEADWDWNLAAERLETTKTKLRKQWHETVRINVVAALTRIGITEESLHHPNG